MDEKSLPLRRKESTGICRIKERHLTICFFEEGFRRSPLLRSVKPALFYWNHCILRPIFRDFEAFEPILIGGMSPFSYIYRSYPPGDGA